MVAWQDDDPYVRKTAAVCVAKLYDINSELVEDRGFLDILKVRIASCITCDRPTRYNLQVPCLGHPQDEDSILYILRTSRCHFPGHQKKCYV